jgi:hypothetical protein
MKPPKIVQLQACTTKEGHVLYGLDEAGRSWVYDGATRSWIALGTDFLEPRAAVAQGSSHAQ